MAIGIGDVVKLKSGGPNVTVERTKVDRVEVVWFTEKGQELTEFHGVA